MKGLGIYICVGAVVAVAAAGADEPEWYTTTVDDNGPVGMMCNIALDGDDRPHVVYFNRNLVPELRSLRYAYYDGNDWDISDVEVGVRISVGQYCDIAIDSSGHPHVSYSVSYEFPTNRGELRYAYHDGSRWHVDVVGDSGLRGSHTSIALDSRGRPHISYREEHDFYVGVLKYSYYDGSSWHTTVIDGGADLGYHTSIAIDSSDNPHISYHYYEWNNKDSRLKYASYDGSSWNVETVDPHGKGTSLALDSSDRPHISYTVSDTKDLKYAYKDGGRWYITTVDDDLAKKRTSIALDENGRPHISYHASWSTGRYSESEFRYAYYDGADWLISCLEKSEEDESIGMYNSLALDSYGDPHIVYVFFPKQDEDEYLKYACRVGNYINYFTAAPRGYDGLALKWSIKSPLGEQIEAFNLYRREKGEEEWSKITDTPLPGGGSGSYDDAGLACMRCYEYALEGIIKGGKRLLGVTDGTTTAPQAHVLYAPRPNPSSSRAVIAFELMDRADVELTVYDLSGRKVTTLAAGWLPPGAHEREVSALAPGVYVYRLTAGDWAGAKKMVVVR